MDKKQRGYNKNGPFTR